MITEEHIDHLAKLARLDVSGAEKDKYAEQISAILDYFEQLKELDTEGVEPLARVFDAQNTTRGDEVKKIFSSDNVLAEAPELDNRQIKVKNVFERS